MSKRLFLTLPDAIANALERWAKQDGGKPTSLAGFLVEREVRAALARGEIMSEDELSEADNQNQDEQLRQVGRALEALAGGEPLPRDICVSTLAEALGINGDVIAKLWVISNGNSKTKQSSH